MRFAPTEIAGVTIIDIDPSTDDRGAFARLYCPDEFASAGFPFVPIQTSLSRNTHTQTLRGLHYEAYPREEAKLVRVSQGSIFDVAVDVRPNSRTYLKWVGVELSGQNGRALLIGRGMAHGFITLEENTDVLYQIDRIYEPGHGQGYRWDDPAFGIKWPVEPKVMSERDSAYESLKVQV